MALAMPGREQIYFTDGFLGNGNVRSWALRTRGDAATYENQVREAIRRVNPNLLVAEMVPATEVVEAAQAGTRFSLLLIGVFAVIAGVAFGGVRLLVKRLLPGKVFDRDSQLQVLQLGLGSKPIQVQDFYGIAKPEGAKPPVE